ncbi:hypothetical protein GW17_00060864, partial [Ensete ventricosum]
IRGVGDGLERKKTTVVERRQRLKAAHWCDKEEGTGSDEWLAGGLVGGVRRPFKRRSSTTTKPPGTGSDLGAVLSMAKLPGLGFVVVLHHLCRYS